MPTFIRVKDSAPKGYTTAVHDINGARVELGKGDFAEVRSSDANSYVNNYWATLERLDTTLEVMQGKKPKAESKVEEPKEPETKTKEEKEEEPKVEEPKQPETPKKWKNK